MEILDSWSARQRGKSKGSATVGIVLLTVGAAFLITAFAIAVGKHQFVRSAKTPREKSSGSMPAGRILRSNSPIIWAPGYRIRKGSDLRL